MQLTDKEKEIICKSLQSQKNKWKNYNYTKRVNEPFISNETIKEVENLIIKFETIYKGLNHE